MDWLFALTVAAGVLGVLYTFRFLRQTLPRRRYQRQAQNLADYINCAQKELQLSPRDSSSAIVPESETFLEACYEILEDGK